MCAQVPLCIRLPLFVFFLRGCVSRVLLERPKHEDGTETLG